MSAAVTSLKHYRLAGLIASRFYTRRGLPGALLWGSIFGITVISSAWGFVTAYQTPASRAVLAHSFDSNVGLKVLLGAPQHLDTVAGFTAWRSLGLVIIVGAIWGLLTSTKRFRGEEMAGRWEGFLVGQTTARRASANLLLALAAELGVVYAAVAFCTVAIGQTAKVDFSVQSSLFFALCMCASPALFLSFGALTSQIMPIRSRAAAMAAGLFGVSFGLRALAHATDSLHWMLNISPLGWIENAHPLLASNPIWLLPIAGLTVLFSVAALILAGRRDLGESILADKDSSRPRLRLLGGVLPASFRLTRTNIFGWLAATSLLSFVFGFVAKSAGQTFAQSSGGASRIIGRIVSSQAQVLGTTTFFGIIFLLAMLVLMAQAASSASAVREDEAEGYLDNLLVRRVSRLGWLGDRLILSWLTIGVGGILAGCFAWLSSAAQHSGVAFHLLFEAGLNATAAPVLVLGLAIFTFGWLPRATSFVGYGLIAWSFLLEIIGSAVNLNHWLLDASLLHNVTLAPAASPNWQVDYVYFVLGLCGIALGAWRFNHRDLANE